MIVNKDQIKEILITELNYKQHEAESYADKYPSFIYDELVPAFEHWLKNRTVLDVVVYGVTISQVMNVQHFHFLMAVKAINRLLDPSLSADKRESMSKHLLISPIRW